MSSTIGQLEADLQRLVPRGAPFAAREPFTDDEANWWNRGRQAGILQFQSCDRSCPRRRRFGEAGPDEFVTPSGALRHIFSRPPAPNLNREYIPHLAAYARAILDFGYDPARSAFSLYRAFSRTLLTKRLGQSFESDAEFYGCDGALYLHIEAKASRAQVAKIGRQLDVAGSLTELPLGTVKEIEYVLDLRPSYLWLVGPGTIDPAVHAYAVRVHALTARFDPLPDVPRAPRC